MYDQVVNLFGLATPPFSEASQAFRKHIGAVGQVPCSDEQRQAGMSELVTIDSSLLHFARLMGVKVTSYWGPTDPSTLLCPRDPALDVTHYSRISCSPCVHITATAPCKGNNLCMRFAVDPGCKENRNPAWVSQ